MSDMLDDASDQVTNLSVAIDGIHEASGHTMATIQDLVSNAETACEKIASNASSLERLERLCDQLQAHRKPQADTSEATDQTVIARIFESYTIARERDVHKEILGDPLNHVELTAPEEASNDDDDPLAAVFF